MIWMLKFKPRHRNTLGRNSLLTEIQVVPEYHCSMNHLHRNSWLEMGNTDDNLGSNVGYSEH